MNKYDYLDDIDPKESYTFRQTELSPIKRIQVNMYFEFDGGYSENISAEVTIYPGEHIDTDDLVWLEGPSDELLDLLNFDEAAMADFIARGMG